MDNNIEWEKVGSMTTDRMWNGKDTPRAEGDSIVGRYISKSENIGENNSTMYVLEVENGEKVGIWGTIVLDGKFKQIAIGKMVKIEYLGKKDSPNRKGKQYHDFEVFQGKDYPQDEGK